MRKILILFILSLIVLGACTQTQSSGEKEPRGDTSLDSVDLRCDWERGPCENILREGYYFNKDSLRCELVPKGSSGCEEIPFDSVQECAAVCES
jgi:hypothetical protein